MNISFDRVMAICPKAHHDQLRQAFDLYGTKEGEILFRHILDVVGFESSLEYLLGVEKYAVELRLFAIWCALNVKHLIENKKTIEDLEEELRYKGGRPSVTDTHAAYRHAVDSLNGVMTGHVVWLARNAVVCALYPLDLESAHSSPNIRLTETVNYVVQALSSYAQDVEGTRNTIYKDLEEEFRHILRCIEDFIPYTPTPIITPDTPDPLPSIFGTLYGANEAQQNSPWADVAINRPVWAYYWLTEGASKDEIIKKYVEDGILRIKKTPSIEEFLLKYIENRELKDIPIFCRESILERIIPFIDLNAYKNKLIANKEIAIIDVVEGLFIIELK